MPAKSSATAKKEFLKDPQGGLTAAGRASFKKKEGANLKPGVKGAADTPEKMKRKGSFLRRHFANPNPGPMKDEKGRPTRRALSAQAWGEPVPTTRGDVKKLARKGSELLEKFHEGTDGKSNVKPPRVVKARPTAKKLSAKQTRTKTPAAKKVS